MGVSIRERGNLIFAENPVPKVRQGDTDTGEATSDILHMGWSWITGTPIITVWLMGLDIATLNLPHDRKLEMQFALGMRTAF